MLRKYNKIVIALVIMLLPVVAYGQGGINSPYSMLGIGELSNTGFGRNIAMGNVMSSLISPVQINSANPASYSYIPLNTFIFEFGMNMKFYQLKSKSNEFANVTGNISYVGIGFPITKWLKTGIGLKPISSMGYEINELDKVNDKNSVVNSYAGEGGLNCVYLDNSVAVTKDISLGLKLSYVFGTLDKDKQIINIAQKGDKSASRISEFHHSVVDAISLGFGAHYHKVITPNFILNLGATYNLKTDLNGSHDRMAISRITKSNEKVVKDTILNERVSKGAIELPMSYSLGASVVLNKQLEIAADYKVEDWSNCKIFGKQQNFEKDERYSLGLEYAPDINSTKYFKVVRYRAGFSLNNSYLTVQNKRLKEYTATIGFGLPLRRFAIINLSGSYSRRYVPGLDILKENIFQIHLNFSFRSTWFVKSKFY